MNLVKAVIADSRVLDGRLWRLKGGYGDVAGRKEEVEICGVEERSGLGSAGMAKDTTALSAMMTAFKERKGDATVEVVAIGREGVGLGHVSG